DPYGKIVTETPIGVRTIIDGTAAFRSDRTLYKQYGDVFAYLNVALVIALLAWRENARRTDCTIAKTQSSQRGCADVPLTWSRSSASSMSCRSNSPNLTSGPTKTGPEKSYKTAPAWKRASNSIDK